jgi:Mn2+/Fe2+ NRAMP family transporter
MEIIIIVGVCLIVLFILFRIFKTFLKWGIILLVLFFVVAYFTNPEELTHHESLKETVKENVTDKLKIDDYKVFSLTKIKVKGEEKIVGIGAFGKVWYFNDLKKSLKK